MDRGFAAIAGEQSEASLLGVKSNLTAFEGLGQTAGEYDVLRCTGHELAAGHYEPDKIRRPQRQLEIVR